ncbi:MAG TPA: peptidoglycan DD-metalloendopeptidase family protein [Candidatus Cryptobacteroides intestinipullorum]|nr:peptidoglycan DD-metalloendopeptidase family protein [Candidatus Cryptobacteroides intestinipullorum]
MKPFCSIFLVSAMLVCQCMTVSAQDTRAYEARKASLEKEIAILDRQLAENAAESRSQLSRLTLVQAKVAGRKSLIRESERQIRRYSDDIYLTQRKINRLNARLDTLSSYYSSLIRNAYKNRDARVWYMYILASDNLGQAFRRYSYFKNLSEQARVQGDRIKAAREELEDQRTKLRRLKSEAEDVKEERVKELASLQKEEAEASSIISGLRRDKSKYEKELAAKKKEVEALDREIKRIIQAAMKAADSGKSDQKIDYKLAEEFSKNKGRLPWPVSGVVVDRFGQHYHPVFTHVKLPFNNGITIAVAKGAEVDVVFDGVVKQIVVMPGYNQCVLVQHGNYFTFYCKLKSTAVKPGDKVRTGQKIGTVDTINGETQLHFQVWQGNKPQNPESWLRPR